MQEKNIISNSTSFVLASKVKDYFLLIKFTLSFMVVFSTVISYLLAPNIRFDLLEVLLLFTGGMLVTGSANTINQILEKDTDKLMKRTASRPVASGRMHENEAWAFAGITGALGILIMYRFSTEAALLSLLSLVLYGFIYTPLKKVNSIAVLMGAIPGALPCLIGWVASFEEGSNNVWTGGWILFAIQFLWQFPHFWAIAWMLHDDYQKAGYWMLPTRGGRDKKGGYQILIYTVLLIIVAMTPIYYGMCGPKALLLILPISLWVLAKAFALFRSLEIADARKLLYSTLIFTPVVFLGYIIF